jgi:hypothetical protein
MGNKYLILIIAGVVLMLILLIIIYTCDFFPTEAPPTSQKEEPRQIPETSKPVNPEPKKDIPLAKKPVKDEVKPASTPKDNPKVSVPAPQEEKPAVPEELFEFLTEYNGHTYYKSKKIVHWDEAAAICPKYGGHLVTITSAEENQALIAAIKAKNIRRNIWIGLSDHEQEGKWKWITGEEVTFTYWDATQPDNWARTELREEDFALFWLDGKAKLAYHWNDACDLGTALFILEIEAK